MLMGNRPEFHVADVAVLLLGATPISIYNSSSPEQIAYLAGHAEAPVAIVEDADFLDRVLEVRADLPALRHSIVVERLDATGVESLGRAARRGDPSASRPRRRSRSRRSGTIIYTSGTTGPPKGVMLDHAQHLLDGRQPARGTRLRTRPLAHRVLPPDGPHRRAHHHALRRHRVRVRGHDLRRHPARSAAALARDATPHPLRCAADLREDPQHGAGRARRRSGRAESSRRRSRSARAVAEHRGAVRSVSVELAAEYAKVDAEDLRPVRQLLGLDDLRVAVTSAAPIPVEVLQFFRALGVPLSELYGMSESTGPMTWDAGARKPGTVGRRDPGHGGAARRRRRGHRAAAATCSAATSTTPRRRPRRSTPTAGSTPATSASSTTRATCASSTARRSSSSPPAARTSRPPTSRPRSRRSR